MAETRRRGKTKIRGELGRGRVADDVEPARERVLGRGHLAPLDHGHDHRARKLRDDVGLKEEPRLDLDSSTIS